MTVNIGDHFERMMADLLAGGRFQNQSEVIRAGLRLLEEKEYGYDEQLETELASRLDHGASTPWPRKDVDAIRRLGRAKLKRVGFRKAA